MSQPVQQAVILTERIPERLARLLKSFERMLKSFEQIRKSFERLRNGKRTEFHSKTEIYAEILPIFVINY